MNSETGIPQDTNDTNNEIIQQESLYPTLSPTVSQDDEKKTLLPRKTSNNNSTASLEALDTSEDKKVKVKRKPYIPSQNDPQFNRFKYYSKLSSTSKSAAVQNYGSTKDQEEGITDSESNFEGQQNPKTIELFAVPPPHIVPLEYFESPSFLSRICGFDTQSLSTVFSIWNTMVGSTLLSMAWGFRESGVILGVIIFLIIGLISYYTCLLVVKHSVVTGNNLLPGEQEHFEDFSDVCVKYLGKWSQVVALIVSCFILVCAAVAYHIFMTDCFTSIIDGIFHANVKAPLSGENWYWNTIIAPFYLLIILFPLCNFKRLTLLMKVNSCGIFFVLFLLLFVLYACIYAFIFPETTITPPVPPFVPPQNGTNITSLIVTSISTFVSSEESSKSLADFTYYSTIQLLSNNGTTNSSNSTELVLQLKLFDRHWPNLIGILSLSFFIHNLITGIFNNQKKLAANRKLISKKDIQTQTQLGRVQMHYYRDTGIAYILAGLCYLIPGLLGCLAFRYAEVQQQNFLNQFSKSDIFASIARAAVLLQLMSIYPLLLYVVRSQLFGFLTKKPYPHFLLVFLLNVIICAITYCFAAFYPKVGTILQYAGAICGLFYLYLFPIAVHLVAQRQKGKLTWYSLLFHVGLIGLGAAILVLQFIPL